VNDAWFNGFSRSLEQNAIERRQSAERLKTDPCMDVPEVGQHVIADALVLGMGRFPLEAKVLQVAGCNYKVEFVDRTDYQSGDPKVMWIESWVVTAVLPVEQDESNTT
jgi:hypothetical protein